MNRIRILICAALIGVVTAGAIYSFAAAQGTTATDTAKPSLPEPHILEPEFYDENNCQLMPVSEDPEAEWKAYCGPSGPVEDVPVGVRDGSEWESLQGFVGPGYVTVNKDEGVDVDEESVFVLASGTWRARGLVRNRSSDLVTATVTASLYSKDGSTLDIVSAPVAVDTLRPGEPGPFALESRLDASEVVSVSWSVSSATADMKAREFRIFQNWTLPYGDRKPFDLLYSDPHDQSVLPFVLSGDVENLGEPTQNPQVVSAWLDDDGQVRWVATTSSGTVPFNADQAPSFPLTVSTRMTTPFFVVVDDSEVGPLLGSLRPMLWAIGGGR